VSDPKRPLFRQTAIVRPKPPSFDQNRHRSVKIAIVRSKSPSLVRANTTGIREHQRWNGHGTPCPCKDGGHIRSPPHNTDPSAYIDFFLTLVLITCAPLQPRAPQTNQLRNSYKEKKMRSESYQFTPTEAAALTELNEMKKSDFSNKEDFYLHCVEALNAQDLASRSPSFALFLKQIEDWKV
jgi:hypothetical protein